MRLTLVLCAALLLAGCVFTESVFTVNKDNSVDFSFTKKISKEVGKGMMDPEEGIRDDSLAYATYGMGVKAFEDEENIGVTADRQFGRITDLNAFPLLADTTKVPLSSLVREEKTSGGSLLTISYKPDMNKIMSAGKADGDADETAEMMDQVLKNKITWKVPFEVVSTNAKVRNDTLGVYSWEFEGTEGDSIFLQYKVPTPAAAMAKKLSSLLWVIPLLAVLGVALFFLLRKKKPQPQTQFQSPLESNWPPREDAPPPENSWPKENPQPPADDPED